MRGLFADLRSSYEEELNDSGMPERDQRSTLKMIAKQMNLLEVDLQLRYAGDFLEIDQNQSLSSYTRFDGKNTYEGEVLGREYVSSKTLPDEK